ncbi:PREDICTED: symplekin-like, partial [Priapulus caudatus]|uniref:Symplekin-like n=1 Tax=Priapulus caudatus TaxID=37621 RepID=A0ABM1F1I6_PRICU
MRARVRQTQPATRRVARLLGTQLVHAGYGVGQTQPAASQAEGATDEAGKSSKHTIQTVVGGSIELKQKKTLLPSMPKKAKKMITQFRLQDVTKALTADQQRTMAADCIKRIVMSEKCAINGGANLSRIKVLASLVTQFGGELKQLLLDFIFSDVRQRVDLMLSWLYQEYAEFQGFTSTMGEHSKGDPAHYNHCLVSLLQGLLSKHEGKDRVSAFVNRPAAVTVVTQRGQRTASSCVCTCVRYMSTDLSLHGLLTAAGGGDGGDAAWTEDSIKLCLYLVLALLPDNHALIHELAAVYTAAVADIKRTILRVLEAPVKGMGMNSPELLLLVENCPKGAETLVTRIIHILTDKSPPSQQLVERVRDLYHKRVSDVRFLIPVLTGLSKREVIAALPKLIRLNPNVVKEVFNRLLGVNVEAGSGPLSPAELLVALHMIDPTKVDMKCIIKASGPCVSQEEEVYTPGGGRCRRAMRTVIQVLSLRRLPAPHRLVMNTLHRLIERQVWKQKKVWVGFVKCCQQTMPQSLQVLLELPAEQLADVFKISPEVRLPLLRHVQSFTDHQRDHLNKDIVKVLEKEPVKVEPHPEKLVVVMATEGAADVKLPGVVAVSAADVVLVKQEAK